MPRPDRRTARAGGCTERRDKYPRPQPPREVDPSSALYGSSDPVSTMKVCIVGASGKLGRYMVQHALDRGYGVVGVCRAESVGKLDAFKERITIVPGATDDRDVIKRAVAGCDGVLVVLVPWGVHHYATGTTQAVLDFSPREARLVFSA